MRELVINSWCDPCQRDGVRAPAGTFTVTLGLADRNLGPLELELCDVHAKELLVPLAEALEVHGRVPQGPAAAAAGKAPTPARSSQPALPGTMAARVIGAPGGKYPCPECGQVLSTYSALTTHTQRIHRHGPASYYGEQCPLCGQTFARLAQHTSRFHGQADIVQTFLLAKHEGDKHGVVRAVERDWAAASLASGG